MPVVDVSVLSASEVQGVSTKKSFCVYVRLQGQAIRTKPASQDRSNEIRFGERFRFQYQPDSRRPGRNRMFVELWTKSLFSQACVSVAWIEMDEQRFVRGQQARLNVRGTFEGKSATISLVITPLDFGETPGMAPAQQQQQQPAYAVPAAPAQTPHPVNGGYSNVPNQMPYPMHQPQQQQPAYAVPAAPAQTPHPVNGGYSNVPNQMPYPMHQPQQQPPAAMYNAGPAEGVPLSQPDPYTTASYMPNAMPVVQDPYNPNGYQCEAAPLPPQPDAFVGASLPPPLYPGLSQPNARPGAGQYYPEALPAPSGKQEYDYGNDYPVKPKQL